MVAASVALCAVSLGALANAGQFYKWKDVQGVVHYSQTPPSDQSSQKIFISDGHPLPPPPGMDSQRQQPRENGRAKQAVELLKVDAKAAAANCATARLNIERLHHSRTIVSTGDADTARTLDSDQRQKALELAGRQQAHYCVKQ
jgi:hypothetical protein